MRVPGQSANLAPFLAKRAWTEFRPLSSPTKRARTNSAHHLPNQASMDEFRPPPPQPSEHGQKSLIGCMLRGRDGGIFAYRANDGQKSPMGCKELHPFGEKRPEIQPFGDFCPLQALSLQPIAQICPSLKPPGTPTPIPAVFQLRRKTGAHVRGRHMSGHGDDGMLTHVRVHMSGYTCQGTGMTAYLENGHVSESGDDGMFKHMSHVRRRG